MNIDWTFQGRAARGGHAGSDRTSISASSIVFCATLQTLT